jgi:twitching motility protein PilT
MEITDLLQFAVKNGASDIHLSPKNPPMFRINGDIVPLEGEPLDTNVIKQMMYSVMTDYQHTEFERDMELDFAISYGEKMRFRVNMFSGINGVGAVMRNIPTEIKSLEKLGTPPIFQKLCQLHKGLILVTGPTGSGKSTTLAAMVDYINSTTAKHILTIEDPIEFVHKSKYSLVNQREVGRHTASFSRALKSALREDPDVILVGELRDMETVQLALTAAETGHLVMGTLHTSSAPKTVDRIIDVFPAGSKEMIRAMLSVSLEAVITQALLKRSDGEGRVAAFEILLGTPAVRNLIREGKIPQIFSAMQTGSKVGMKMMRDSIYDLVSQGAISEEEARKYLVISAEEGGGEPAPSSANANSGAAAYKPNESGENSAKEKPEDSVTPLPPRPTIAPLTINSSKSYSGF